MIVTFDKKVVTFDKKVVGCYSKIVHEIYCCDCFFDKMICLLLNEEKENVSIEEAIGENLDETEFLVRRCFDIVVLSCLNYLKFISGKKNLKELFKKIETKKIISCKSFEDMCSICSIGVSKKLNCFHRFSKRQNEDIQLLLSFGQTFSDGS